MHHLNDNETHGEKVRWELHKNTMWSFEQILEAKIHSKKQLYSYLPPILQTIKVS